MKKIIAHKNHNYSHKLKYKICVSGAALTDTCAPGTLEMAEELGREIAKRSLILTTGATTGIPYWAAKGAKAEGGFVIGLSPASSKAHHIKTYHLPTDYHDLIIYTGFHYAGRNLLLTRASDAVITICGRMGTLNEFTIAFEEHKPMGVLEGTGGVADIVRELIQSAHRGAEKIVFSKRPADLLDKVLDLIEAEEKENGVKGRVL